MMESLGFLQSEAQAMVGIPVIISYRDTSGKLTSVSATIRYVTPIGFAATQATTGQIMLFAYGQIVSVEKVQTFNWKDLLLYGGGTLAFVVVFGRFGVEQLWKRRSHGKR